MFSRLRGKTPEQRFWQWFEKNSARLMNYESDQETIFDELTEQLHKINPDLTFEFGPIADGKREFIVSADGIREAFPAVQSLVDAAPPLGNWIVIPFRPAQGVGFNVRIDDYTLSPQDIYFSYQEDGDRTGIVLYIKGLSPENEGIAAQASFILLDTALGEYVVEEKVGFIERLPLSDDPDAEGLHPFASIQQVFEIQSH